MDIDICFLRSRDDYFFCKSCALSSVMSMSKKFKTKNTIYLHNFLISFWSWDRILGCNCIKYLCILCLVLVDIDIFLGGWTDYFFGKSRALLSVMSMSMKIKAKNTKCPHNFLISFWSWDKIWGFDCIKFLCIFC